MERKEKSLLPFEYDEYMEVDKWINEIPFIKFPSDWEIKVIPPFAGAVIRFMVKKGDAYVSVYLDCYDFLGCCGQPYWEVYPYNNDVYRCALNETDKLLQAIQESIDQNMIIINATEN